MGLIKRAMTIISIAILVCIVFVAAAIVGTLIGELFFKVVELYKI